MIGARAMSGRSESADRVEQRVGRGDSLEQRPCSLVGGIGERRGRECVREVVTRTTITDFGQARAPAPTVRRAKARRAATRAIARRKGEAAPTAECERDREVRLEAVLAEKTQRMRVTLHTRGRARTRRPPTQLQRVRAVVSARRASARERTEDKHNRQEWAGEPAGAAALAGHLRRDPTRR